MKSRYILFRRGRVYYVEDTVTRKQSSLRTKVEAEAMVLLNARNESFRQPLLNLQIARAYLTASDPAMAARIWQDVMEEIQSHVGLTGWQVVVIHDAAQLARGGKTNTVQPPFRTIAQFCSAFARATLRPTHPGLARLPAFRPRKGEQMSLHVPETQG